MKWISDRQPKSPGLYMVRGLYPDFYLVTINFTPFAYWDGMGWMLPQHAGEKAPYRTVEKWAKIEWGQDEEN